MMFIIWKLFVSILSFEYDCQVSFNYPLNELQFQLRIILKKVKMFVSRKISSVLNLIWHCLVP